MLVGWLPFSTTKNFLENTDHNSKLFKFHETFRGKFADTINVTYIAEDILVQVLRLSRFLGFPSVWSRLATVPAKEVDEVQPSTKQAVVERKYLYTFRAAQTPTRRPRLLGWQQGQL